MNVDRFVRTELRVERVQPFVPELSTLLCDWGLCDSTQERLWVITYDSIEQVRTVNEIAVGGYHELDIPIPALLTAVLLAGTDRFMVAHNHPSGDLMPSTMDVDMTRTIMGAANAAGLMLDDHLIVGPKGGTFSLTEHGLLLPSPKSLAMANAPGHRRAV